MPLAVKFQFERSELDTQLKEIGQFIASRKREAVRNIGKFLFDRTKRDIETKSKGGTGEDGGRWRRLSKQRLRRKQRQGLPSDIGVQTGETLNVQFGRLSYVKDQAKIRVGGPKRFLFNAQRPIIAKNWFKNARKPCIDIILRSFNEVAPTAE
jgi:hypothetical protein